MKLAEALMIRADLQKQLASLRTRIERNIYVQEGELPDEDPLELMTTAQQLNTQLHTLIMHIQYTNATVKLSNQKTMLEMLIERDELMNRHKIIMAALNTARGSTERYSMREIKWVATIPVKNLQRQADDVADNIRQINVLIQAANWQADLIVSR